MSLNAEYVCARCGRAMPYLEAAIYKDDAVIPLCHFGFGDDVFNCYRMVTVYGASYRTSPIPSSGTDAG